MNWINVLQKKDGDLNLKGIRWREIIIVGGEIRGLSD